MPETNPADQEVTALLTHASTIAMVGASSSPEKPSHGIMQTLPNAGCRVPERIDIVDVFRKAEDTPPIADEAVQVGAKALWSQDGISSDEAASRAKAGGLTVVMNKCIGATHAALRIPKKDRR